MRLGKISVFYLLRCWWFDGVLNVHNSTLGIYVANVYAGFVGGVDDLDFAALV